MRQILYKAKGRDGEGWQNGYYWCTWDTSYCFKEDYEKHPENTHHYILFDRMTDWGLPNRKLKMDIIPETLCQFAGVRCFKEVKEEKCLTRVWEHDLIEIDWEGKKITAEVRYERCMFILASDELPGGFIPLYSCADAENPGQIINAVHRGNIFDDKY